MNRYHGDIYKQSKTIIQIDDYFPQLVFGLKVIILITAVTIYFSDKCIFKIKIHLMKI